MSVIGIVGLPLLAAVAGAFVRRVAGFVAKRSGYEAEVGEQAAATTGLSLIVEEHDHPDHAVPLSAR
jgi:hypothetical protein